MPNQTKLYDHIKRNAKHKLPMLSHNMRQGESVAICGAGPSLNDHLHEIQRHNEIWACNSALPYLIKQNVQVTHGFSIDQGESMLSESEWSSTHNVHYLVSSSVHPRLLKHLLKEKRQVSLFHSYLGIPDPKGWTDKEPYEMWLYTHLFSSSVQVGYGLNSVPRAVCLALSLGYKDITVYGADCACLPNSPLMPELGTKEYRSWMDALVIYADGRTAGECFGNEAVMAEAPDIDGRRWHTRPDMVISATHMLDLLRDYPGRITLVGDTLPNAFRGKDKTFMDHLPSLTGVGQVSGFGPAGVAA